MFVFHQHPERVKLSTEPKTLQLFVDSTNNLPLGEEAKMTKLCIKGVVPTRACASCGVEYPATIEYFDGDDNASLEPYCLDCAVEQTSQEIEKVLRRIAEHHDEGTSEAFRAAYRSYKQHREVRSLPKSGDRHD